ncbi:MAG: hypothetical protein IJK98_11035 [Clostridia bacterium]|nr:hypothetical protein [Clostridia bacterium]
MKKNIPSVNHKYAIWKALVLLIAVLLMPFVISLIVFAEDVNVMNIAADFIPSENEDLSEEQEQNDITEADHKVVDHITATQKRPIIKDAATGRVAYYLSVFACYKDGTQTAIDWVNSYKVNPADVSALEMGHNTVTVAYKSFSVDVDVEVIENPFAAISVSAEEPLSLLLSKEDGTQERIQIEDGIKQKDGTWEILRPQDIKIIYNEAEGTFSIGDKKSNPVPNVAWMEALGIIERDCVKLNKYYGATIDYVHGNITKENIDRLIPIALTCRGNEENRSDRYSLKEVQDKFLLVFGEENVDLTMSKYYDAETDTIQCDLKIGDGPEKRVLTFENGQYVYRRYGLGDIGYSVTPDMVITYDTDLHITGIYLHDINTTANLPGDVDGDGEVTSADARMALRGSVKLDNFEKGTAAFTAADADGNGVLEAGDARLILRASVKLETLPVTSAA